MFPPTIDPAAAEQQRRLSLAAGAPAAFYLTGEDNLRLRSFSSVAGVTLECSGRIFTADGQIRPFSFTQNANSDRTVASTISGVGDGWLMNLRVAAVAGFPLIGQTWALVEIVRGHTGAVVAIGTLVSGYVSHQQPLAWPGSPMRGTLEGAGVIRAIAGANPAANVEWSETVPTGARWKLLALMVTLATDATVANRFPQLAIDDGATVVFASDPAAAQAASLNRSYTAGQGTTREAAVSATTQWALPVGLTLLAGYRVRSATTNIQATDNWGAPQLLVEEWLEGA